MANAATSIDVSLQRSIEHLIKTETAFCNVVRSFATWRQTFRHHLDNINDDSTLTAGPHTDLDLTSGSLSIEHRREAVASIVRQICGKILDEVFNTLTEIIVTMCNKTRNFDLLLGEAKWIDISQLLNHHGNSLQAPAAFVQTRRAYHMDKIHSYLAEGTSVEICKSRILDHCFEYGKAVAVALSSLKSFQNGQLRLYLTKHYFPSGSSDKALQDCIHARWEALVAERMAHLDKKMIQLYVQDLMIRVQMTDMGQDLHELHQVDLRANLPM
ncbi:hypothetical protein H2200_009021 [Cladophialophora chaetospira]|uniref:Uncharacterized protein n=1 Tax=Cladophialophora chaetospira TaxID=386627 RepID=A0AA38X3F1_9EURO|nr:hypothetical protein H2200_009021 [Cladophialophora chaetospira]